MGLLGIRVPTKRISFVGLGTIGVKMGWLIRGTIREASILGLVY
jgi:hypothetical protein